MGKFSGLLKRVKNFFIDDKNKYRIRNDPRLLDPYYGIPSQLRPDRSKIPRELL